VNAGLDTFSTLKHTLGTPEPVLTSISERYRPRLSPSTPFCNLDGRHSNKVLEVVQTVVTGKSSVSSVLSSEMAAERVEDVQQANAEVQATKD
jgi:hypothetical protein